MAFSELIKDAGKIRDYMRDFYIYGFKSRDDFNKKSARTYDDEKRRIESYLDPYIKWKTDMKGKRIYLSLDTGGISINPLYNAWKAKSFTDNDITLHFTILSALRNGEKSIKELTDEVCTLTDTIYDVQTVRLKANEYVNEGLLTKEKNGRSDFYSLSSYTFEKVPSAENRLKDAVRFFQGTAPLGVVGSTILDDLDEKNDIFKFKHYYIVHTLEDGVLLDILGAIEFEQEIEFKFQSSRNDKIIHIRAVPLKIFISAQTGRRYLCTYSKDTKRFQNHRLDFIKDVEPIGKYEDFDHIKTKLERAKEQCWGVSFGGQSRSEELKMTLRIDEKRDYYVLERLEREGRGGKITRIDKNTYRYETTVYDSGEMMAWVKTFISRIISLESTNKKVIRMFYDDMRRMGEMYAREQ